MSYRTDSTIYRPYGFIDKISRTSAKNKSTLPIPKMLHQGSDLAMPTGTRAPDWIKASIKQKTRGIAWIVSHCHTNMQREDYVMELQKHIDVDIYGACGQLSCPTRRGQHQGNCLKEVEKTHKFYLSFENSHCKDYITEKFWDALDTTMVPVVLGHGHSKVAPEGSFIDAGQFSPKELAALLSKLSKDENVEELLKYHAWKSVYKVYSENR